MEPDSMTGPTEIEQNDAMTTAAVDATKIEPQPQATKKESACSADSAVDSAGADSAMEKKAADASADKEEHQPKQSPARAAGNDIGYDVDPIQVARQVAIEAKMEVDGRAHSSSSSDKLPGGGELQHHSSTPGDDSESMKADSSSSAPVSSDLSLPEEEEEKGSPDKVAPAQEVAEQSQLTEVPAEQEKGLAFDLNTEVFSEAADINNPPVTIAAVTSTFRPSSPRRTAEFDLNSAEVPSGESAAGGKLGFDLNLACQDGDELPVDWMAQRSTLFSQSPASSSSSKNPARFLDLNAVDPYMSRLSHLQPPPAVISIFGTKVEVSRNHHTPPAPPVLQIYNGGAPYSAVPYPHQHAGPMLPYSPAMYAPPGAAAYPYMLDSRGVPVVPKMMGHASAHQPYFPCMPGGPLSNGTGPAIPQAMGSTSAQQAYFLSMTGGPSSNGTGSRIPHQFMGSTSAHQPPLYQMPSGPPSDGSGPAIIPQPIGPASLQPPFYMGMSSGPPSHGPGPGSVPSSRSSFDLTNNNNAGGSRNMGFVAPAGLSWDVSSSQASSSSGAGAKRKEPESGQEEPASYRQQQPQPRTWN